MHMCAWELKFLKAWIIPQRTSHPKVVDSCAYAHYPVPCPEPCEPAGTLDDMEPLDAHNGMFDDYPSLPDVLVVPFLHPAQFPVVRFFERHGNVDTLGPVPLEAGILPKAGAQRVPAVLHVGDLFVVHRAKVGAAQKDNVLVIEAIDLVLVGVVFFFLAVHGLLGLVVNGPRHGLFHDIVVDHARICEAFEESRQAAALPAGGKAQSPQRIVQQGGQQFDPKAHLCLRQAEGRRMELLQWVLFEIGQQEKKLVPGSGQGRRILFAMPERLVPPFALKRPDPVELVPLFRKHGQ